MAINNSLGTPEVKSPSLLTQSCEPDSRARVWISTTFLVFSPSLSSSPFSHFTHLQSGGLLTLICHTSSLPVRQRPTPDNQRWNQSTRAVPSCRRSIARNQVECCPVRDRDPHPMLESVYACSSQLQAVDCQENLATNQSN